MGRTGQKGELPNKRDVKSKKKPPAPVEDDDIEDGDIATPKRDRSGNDDEPLLATLMNGGFVVRFRSLPAPGAVREGCHAAAFMDK